MFIETIIKIFDIIKKDAILIVRLFLAMSIFYEVTYESIDL